MKKSLCGDYKPTGRSVNRIFRDERVFPEADGGNRSAKKKAVPPAYGPHRFYERQTFRLSAFT
ncbi:hypothetical protein [Burkholderia sp. 8Y]|uniref:hypothetical protein n=1 Tax=Burkholderia sp. 8Y TaxID=2653133 RepID=UPI00135B30D9|nr:hypothetical protein [Burkholderia sp. 8Y]